MMEITYQPLRSDYITFFRYYTFRASLLLRIVLFIFLFGPMQLGLSRTLFRASDHPVSYVLAAILSFALIFLLPYWIMLQRFNKKLTSGDDPLTEKTIAASKKGLRVAAEHDNNFWEYRSVRKIGITNEAVYIIMFGKGLYLIPFRSFSSQSDATNFYTAMSQQLSLVKSSGGYNDARRLYKWGWLGLIPMIGGFAGLVLLLRGIFEYKDRVLITVGTACILFTVAVYGSLFAFISSAGVKETFIPMARTQLNSLVKSVEFYKMQHGYYPDSLRQATKDESTTDYDMLAPNGFKGPAYYQYKKIGNRYTLFSAGIDGIPGTADDIYPTIGMSDTVKFGIIRVK